MNRDRVMAEIRRKLESRPTDVVAKSICIHEIVNVAQEKRVMLVKSV
jgi:hypothetical protein